MGRDGELSHTECGMQLIFFLIDMLYVKSRGMCNKYERPRPAITAYGRVSEWGKRALADRPPWDHNPQ